MSATERELQRTLGRYLGETITPERLGHLAQMQPEAFEAYINDSTRTQNSVNRELPSFHNNQGLALAETNRLRAQAIRQMKTYKRELSNTSQRNTTPTDPNSNVDETRVGLQRDYESIARNNQSTKPTSPFDSIQKQRDLSKRAKKLHKLCLEKYGEDDERTKLSAKMKEEFGNPIKFYGPNTDRAYLDRFGASVQGDIAGLVSMFILMMALVYRNDEDAQKRQDEEDALEKLMEHLEEMHTYTPEQRDALREELAHDLEQAGVQVSRDENGQPYVDDETWDVVDRDLGLLEEEADLDNHADMDHDTWDVVDTNLADREEEANMDVDADNHTRAKKSGTNWDEEDEEEEVVFDPPQTSSSSSAAPQQGRDALVVSTSTPPQNSTASSSSTAVPETSVPLNRQPTQDEGRVGLRVRTSAPEGQQDLTASSSSSSTAALPANASSTKKPPQDGMRLGSSSGSSSPVEPGLVFRTYFKGPRPQ